VIDIVSTIDGQDIGTFSTQTTRAANILSVQLGSLEYAQDLGIDLKYFLSENFRFQNDSFKAYLIETLASRGINVTDVVDQVEALFSTYNFNLAPEETTSGFVAR
jgi:hypothetical protein